MMRFCFLSIFVLFFIYKSGAQLAKWSLTEDGSPDQIHTNITASVFSCGQGNVSFSSNGAFKSGWPTGELDTNHYFQISISPNAGYRMTISTIAFHERRSNTGIGEYQLQFATNAEFSNANILSTVQVPDNDLARDGTIEGLNIVIEEGNTLYIRWYGYFAESGAGTWRINANTLAVYGSVTESNTNNTDSYVDLPQNQVPQTEISVSSTDIFFELFKFNIKDNGTSDLKPTIVNFITIKNAYPINGANWVDIIKSCKIETESNDISLTNISITDNSIFISISPNSLIINDGHELEVSLKISFNTNNLTDNTNLQFYIAANNHGFDADVSGSGFSTEFSQNINSNIHRINVIATNYITSQSPSFIWQSQSFDLSFIACDDFGNIDTDYYGSATLSLDFGNGSISSINGLTRSFNAGVLIFDSIIYDNIEWLRLVLSSSGISSAYTSLIYSTGQGVIVDDDFNSGNYPNSPNVWMGTTADFIITPSYRLQLYKHSTIANASYIASPVSFAADSIEWQALINIKLDPSANNYVRYFLISDNPILENTKNGYFLQIGETGSNDAIELFSINNGIESLILRGSDGQVASQPNFRFKAILNDNGLWRIYADLLGGTSFELIGEKVDISPIVSNFFTGLLCRYSSSYSEGRFEFDDIYCGPVRIDSIKPEVVNFEVIDTATVRLFFSEAIETNSAQNTENYSFSNSIGNPLNAVQNNTDRSVIDLKLNVPLQSEINYILTVSGLSDLSGNIINTVNIPISFYKVKMFDILINEVMADPTPSVQLPEWEYLELYNRTNYPISLHNWTITVNTTTRTFPDIIIEPSGYVIVCHQNALPYFESYGTTAAIFTSTTILTNAGADLFLNDDRGNLIHSLSYSDAWYKSNWKKDGGWSLEQIDPNNPCGENNNWAESINIKGGSPGARNSVNKPNPDNDLPFLIKAILILPDTVILYFNESIDSFNAINPNSYIVNNNVGHPLHASINDKWNKSVKLVFNNHFHPEIVYAITVTGEISDCVGNKISNKNSAKFAISQMPRNFDIVINEVLFDPPSDGVDFVELYNRSDKVFNLSSLQLVQYKNNEIEKLHPISPQGHYIFPEEYIVITTNPDKVREQYFVPFPHNLIKINSMPSYNNDAGRVVIMNNEFETIDDFSYTTDLHFQLLSTFDGVSIERVNYDLPTIDKNNWHSAAESVGFATPTYRNSQFAIAGVGSGKFSVKPEIFSPDNDGYNDRLEIHYNFDEPGFVANVVIFDSKGRKIKTIANNELLGTEGYFIWDGLNENNQKATIGIYVVFAEVFDLNGNVTSYKAICVLATKLK